MIPNKVILQGDVLQAVTYIGIAESFLFLAKQDANFQSLSQFNVCKRLDDGTKITVFLHNNQATLTIKVPFKQKAREPEKEVRRLMCPCGAVFTFGIVQKVTKPAVDFSSDYEYEVLICKAVENPPDPVLDPEVKNAYINRKTILPGQLGPIVTRRGKTGYTKLIKAIPSDGSTYVVGEFVTLIANPFTTTGTLTTKFYEAQEDPEEHTLDIGACTLKNLIGNHKGAAAIVVPVSFGNRQSYYTTLSTNHLGISEQLVNFDISKELIKISETADPVPPDCAPHEWITPEYDDATPLSYILNVSRLFTGTVLDANRTSGKAKISISGVSEPLELLLKSNSDSFAGDLTPVDYTNSGHVFTVAPLPGVTVGVIANSSIKPIILFDGLEYHLIMIGLFASGYAFCPYRRHTLCCQYSPDFDKYIEHTPEHKKLTYSRDSAKDAQYISTPSQNFNDSNSDYRIDSVGGYGALGDICHVIKMDPILQPISYSDTYWQANYSPIAWTISLSDNPLMIRSAGMPLSARHSSKMAEGVAPELSHVFYPDPAFYPTATVVDIYQTFHCSDNRTFTEIPKTTTDFSEYQCTGVFAEYYYQQALTVHETLAHLFLGVAPGDSVNINSVYPFGTEPATDSALWLIADQACIFSHPYSGAPVEIFKVLHFNIAGTYTANTQDVNPAVHGNPDIPFAYSPIATMTIQTSALVRFKLGDVIESFKHTQNRYVDLSKYYDFYYAKAVFGTRPQLAFVALSVDLSTADCLSETFDFAILTGLQQGPLTVRSTRSHKKVHAYTSANPLNVTFKTSTPDSDIDKLPSTVAAYEDRCLTKI